MSKDKCPKGCTRAKASTVKRIDEYLGIFAHCAPEALPQMVKWLAELRAEVRRLEEREAKEFEDLLADYMAKWKLAEDNYRKHLDAWRQDADDLAEAGAHDINCKSHSVSPDTSSKDWPMCECTCGWNEAFAKHAKLKQGAKGNGDENDDSGTTSP